MIETPILTPFEGFERARAHDRKARHLESRAKQLQDQATQHRRWAEKWRDWADDEDEQVPYPLDKKR